LTTRLRGASGAPMKAAICSESTCRKACEGRGATRSGRARAQRRAGSSGALAVARASRPALGAPDARQVRAAVRGGARLRREALVAPLALALAAARRGRQRLSAPSCTPRGEAGATRQQRLAHDAAPAAASALSDAPLLLLLLRRSRRLRQQKRLHLRAAAHQRSPGAADTAAQAPHLRADEGFALRQRHAQLLLQALADGALRGGAQVCRLQHRVQPRAQGCVADASRRVDRRRRRRRARVGHGGGSGRLLWRGGRRAAGRVGGTRPRK
jgi:hypothetical protein